MKEFHVRWEIEVDAESHEAAAQKALEMQRDPESVATAFTVSATDGEDRSERLVDLHAEVERRIEISVGHIVEHPQTGTLGIVARVHLNGLSVRVGRKGRTQGWPSSSKVVGRVGGSLLPTLEKEGDDG